MNATFYKSTAPPNKVDKSSMLTQVKTVNGLNPYQEVDVMKVRLILEYDEQLVTANYAKVDDFYYFIDEPILRVGGQIVMDLTKDPLMSNLDELMRMEVIVDRSSNEFNSYVFDDRQIGQVNYTTFSADLGHWDYSNGMIVFAVIGGGQ